MRVDSASDFLKTTEEWIEKIRRENLRGDTVLNPEEAEEYLKKARFHLRFLEGEIRSLRDEG